PKYLLGSMNNKRIPFLFKIEYNPCISQQLLRKALDEFSDELKTIRGMPLSLQEKITICYSLPAKLHAKVLKARKARGF
ncbi:MAG TPA: hypothetical protein VHD33_02140, partial [Legionellaceae bacterium]|nr:hypothetical protein [Legionellaceae bacterium]